MLEKIVSGGQTGVDRAALDAALEKSFPCGGWCPAGRLAEDGRIPDCYPLKETSTPSYPERTEKNVCDSDGTLIVTCGPLTGGTALTYQLAVEHQKPCLVVDLAQTTEQEAVHAVWDWLKAENIQVLNVAGPRASQQPQLYGPVKGIVTELIQRTRQQRS